MVKPMLLTLTDDLPGSDEWMYEVKYDGFRVLLHVNEGNITLTSRNGKDFTSQFPEISELKIESDFSPFTLDGELVILNTPYQACFSALQQRGRLRNADKIQRSARQRPAVFMAFDYLNEEKASYIERKKILEELLKTFRHPSIQAVESFPDLKEVEGLVHLHRGEGIIAKRKTSRYEAGVRSKHWLKAKQWRAASGFLTSYDQSNGYYQLQVEEKNNSLYPLGRFKHGMTAEEDHTLRNFFKEKGTRKKQVWELEPSVCVDIHCLNAEKGEMREPTFHQFRFDLSPSDCTLQKLKWDLSLFPEQVEATNLSKELWNGLSKMDYLVYMRMVSPYLLRFLQDKKITLIRYPDGINQPSFYQKHYPDHAPDYVDVFEEAGERYILCQNLSSLMWIANQGALELHLPFQKAGASFPDEIVIDLDPPDQNHFHLAVSAASLLKPLMEKLNIKSFIKTSGNKGMQIHIPIPERTLSYEETRKLTETFARVLVEQEPDLFTIERLKKKRGDRLYIDYVQHAEGKTIIAPYSARATKEATVATPVYWEEVTKNLDPRSFTIKSIVERIERVGCPFSNYEKARYEQPIDQLRNVISDK
ncbi:DNA ligase D [Halobacillus halophilus]|uniref:DNA ligase (ATP) n=1 Tax=Halobacillus halophilus (strain ATCC 35676 / DSM 2266 / JCM 20832 / KCTC 3685 / LMG 17431 / NBRC 102448 / NCIMB 2269) TaxID=866895 RepID=I0JSZ9_HALH3|nr:DNA ligase D [Halobacillus halophilus]ASF41192.1 DNA ligase D [Halobacillus halophilus]CCG47271.1 ATP-dependent DNA ligase [Halobacillus halophilus DSM 2266]